MVLLLLQCVTTNYQTRLSLHFPTDAYLLFWQTQSHRASQLLALKWGYFLVLHLDEWSVSWNGVRMKLHMFWTLLCLENHRVPTYTCSIQRTNYPLRSWMQSILGDYYKYMPSTNGTYIVGVTELDSFHNLPHDFFHVAFISPSWILLKVIKCSVVHKLKHKVEAPFASKHFNQIYQVFMAKLLWKKYDLALLNCKMKYAWFICVDQGKR